ncbi:MAG: peptidylprolyl isomerase [Pseudomonadota bacterium]
MRHFSCHVFAILVTLTPSAWSQTARLETSLGTIVVKLESAKAPDTVRTFIARAKAGEYDETIFHRAVAGFVVNGGEYKAGADHPALEIWPNNGKLRYGEEANNGLGNQRGTMAAMRVSARPGDHSPTGFFFNMKDNPMLDYRRFDQPARLPSPQGEQTVPAGALIPGYTVFGRVVSGMAVLERIEQGKTTAERSPARHWVITPVILKRVVIDG